MGDAAGVYQLGSGGPLSVNGLIEAIAEVVTPRHIEVQFAPPRAGEVLNTWCDISHARKALGYAPSMPLAEGLNRTWAWFLEQS